MSAAQVLIVVTIVLYLAAMLLIGFYFSRKGGSGSSDEFYIGGRKLGPLVTAMSAEASDMSSYLLMGLPGLAYFAGIAEVGWTAIGLAVGTYLNFLFVAKLLRRYTARLNAITLPDFFSRRYGDKRHLLSCIAALIIIIFFVPYTASGFKAVGMDAVIANAKELPGYLSLTQGYNAATGEAGTYGFLSIVSTLAWGLGYFGMPHILLRFMAIRDEKELATSRRIASVWVVISMGIAVFIGIIGYSVSKVGAIPFLTTSSDAETVIIKMADLMSRNGVLFAIVAGIILAGILAATMSTADSQLLAAASAVSQDLMQEFFKVKLSRKASMHAARGTVFGIALIALILAWNPNSSVFRVVSFAWAGFGACFGPTVLLALYWKRSNRQGALAGLIVGGVMVFVWKYLVAPMGGAFAIYELLPAFVLGMIVNIVVSLMTPEPDEGIQLLYDEVHKK